MNIVADENIPFVREAFAPLGDIEVVPGRSITRDTLADAELLLVRTVTQVNEVLLDGTPVRFVGTATAGLDHIDQAYLRERGIGFAGAQGSNARGVAEYVTLALLHLADTFNFELRDRTLGIVGCGHVGRLVLRMATALGMRCVVNDPPLARSTAEPVYRPLDEIFDCDIVTLHTSLEPGGSDPTFHLVDEEFLARMQPGAMLINTARGPVVDTNALKTALKKESLRACVLDVWEGEPSIDLELMDMATIATPHIAGYSLDGKVAGTRMILDAACNHFGIDHDWDATPLLPTPWPETTLDSTDTASLRAAARKIYDITADDARLREISALPQSERPAYFDALRRDYPIRREFLIEASSAPAARVR